MFFHLIKNGEFYFIGGIFFFMFLYLLIAMDIENRKNGVGLFTARSVLFVFFVMAVWACLMYFTKKKVDGMRIYLQDKNEYFLEKGFCDTFRGIAELDKEDFILLEKKVLEYEKEKKEIERAKRRTGRKAKREAELRTKQEILNTQKEIEKSARE